MLIQKWYLFCESFKCALLIVLLCYILGVTLTNAEVVYVPTTTETMEESTTPDDGDIDTNVVIYAAVGGSLGAVLIVIIVAAVIVKMKTA